MKTKDKVKQSRSQGVEEFRNGRPRNARDRPGRAAAWKSAGGSSTSRLGTSPEQSENVYENKGQVQKVAASQTARPNPGGTSLAANWFDRTVTNTSKLHTSTAAAWRCRYEIVAFA